jgi:hypothetical protein
MENYELKTRISLVMERSEIVKKQYDERNLARICAGLISTTAGIFSAGTALFEKYEASLAGLGTFAISGTIFYFLNKNVQRRKEQLNFLENRKSELEEKVKNAE